MSTYFSQLHDAIRAGIPAAVVSVVGGPRLGKSILVIGDAIAAGTLDDPGLDATALDLARTQLQARSPARLTQGEDDLFIDLYLPPKRLFIVGAVHAAIPLVTFARTLGFQTTVLDARGVFATAERFPHADRLRVGWPADSLAEAGLDESSYVVVLTHDAKIDNPALLLALDSPAPYIGALGSRRTHAARCDALRELGATDEQLARIHAPIGLNLGGRHPEEIALAIMAEIVAVDHGCL